MPVVVVESNTEMARSLIKHSINAGLQESGVIVERAAKSKCPVDTGRLRNSLTYRKEGDAVTVGSNVEYAPYVELGTSKMKAQPYLLPAMQDNRESIKAAFSKYFD